MTTELTLLLALFAYLIIGVFLGDTGPRNVFFQSAPRLGARVEAHLSIGRGFVVPVTLQKQKWVRPRGGAPEGVL